jgi:hypothetical protein
VPDHADLAHAASESDKRPAKDIQTETISHFGQTACRCRMDWIDKDRLCRSTAIECRCHVPQNRDDHDGETLPVRTTRRHQITRRTDRLSVTCQSSTSRPIGCRQERQNLPLHGGSSRLQQTRDGCRIFCHIQHHIPDLCWVARVLFVYRSLLWLNPRSQCRNSRAHFKTRTGTLAVSEFAGKHHVRREPVLVLKPTVAIHCCIAI